MRIFSFFSKTRLLLFTTTGPVQSGSFVINRRILSNDFVCLMSFVTVLAQRRMRRGQNKLRRHFLSLVVGERVSVFRRCERESEPYRCKYLIFVLLCTDGGVIDDSFLSATLLRDVTTTGGNPVRDRSDACFPSDVKETVRATPRFSLRQTE